MAVRRLGSPLIYTVLLIMATCAVLIVVAKSLLSTAQTSRYALDVYVKHPFAGGTFNVLPQ
ncbi:MAG: hypothetical protein MN733_31335, partial [Nitrososphaera sp.]|nr:hypothetical protein [Nitrososphaera sp.]